MLPMGYIVAAPACMAGVQYVQEYGPVLLVGSLTFGSALLMVALAILDGVCVLPCTHCTELQGGHGITCVLKIAITRLVV